MSYLARRKALIERIYSDASACDACANACTLDPPPGQPVPVPHLEHHARQRRVAMFWLAEAPSTAAIDETGLLCMKCNPETGVTLARELWCASFAPQDFTYADFYPTNALKHKVSPIGRPQLERCKRFLVRELEAVRPICIVTHGLNAIKALDTISPFPPARQKLRDVVQKAHHWRDLPVFCLRHCAHSGGGRPKQELLEDWKWTAAEVAKLARP